MWLVAHYLRGASTMIHMGIICTLGCGISADNILLRPVPWYCDTLLNILNIL